MKNIQDRAKISNFQEDSSYHNYKVLSPRYARLKDPRKRISPAGIVRVVLFMLVFLAMGAGIFLYIHYVCSGRLEIMAYINGVPVGYVKHRGIIERGIAEYAENVYDEFGESYSFDGEISYKLENITDKDKQQSVTYLDETASASLFAKRSENRYVFAAVLSINGTIIGATADIEGANLVLEQIRKEAEDKFNQLGFGIEITNIDKYSRAVNETVYPQWTAVILDDITIEEKLCDAKDLIAADQLCQKLLGLAQTQTTPLPAETGAAVFSAAAAMRDSDDGEGTDPSNDINPNIEYGLARVCLEEQCGDMQAGTPACLTIGYTCTEKVTDKLLFKTVYEYTNTRFEGYKRTKTRGADGFAEYIYQYTYSKNGQILSSEIIGKNIIKEAVDKVIVVGTRPVTEPGIVTGEFLWPFMPDFGDMVVTSEYGINRKQYDGDGFHLGIDLQAEIGTSVYASDGGMVYYIGETRSYGKMVIIDHGNGYQTAYAHLDEFKVTEREKVSQGQLIALSGNTGVTNGPHLHFEVRVNGQCEDPRNYLPEIP